jgi:hypothetical protein
MANIFAYPSFYSLVVTGIATMVALILFATNYRQLTRYQVIVSLSAIGVLIGIHGILHALYEDTTKPTIML